MKSVAHELEQIFGRAIKAAFGIDAEPLISVSANDKFGDYQSNAAMGLAKTLSHKPRDVAEKIKASLQLGEMASEISIAGPGFINIKLNPKWLEKRLSEIARDPRLGMEK